MKIRGVYVVSMHSSLVKPLYVYLEIYVYICGNVFTFTAI